MYIRSCAQFSPNVYIRGPAGAENPKTYIYVIRIERVKEKAKTDLINKELQFLSNYNKTTENNETRDTECFSIANENEEIAEGSCEEESDEFNTSLRSIMNIHEIYQSSPDTLPGGSPECFDKKKKQCKENTRLQKDKGFANREFQVKLPEQTGASAQKSNDRYFPKSKSKNTCHFCFLKEKKIDEMKEELKCVKEDNARLQNIVDQGLYTGEVKLILYKSLNRLVVSTLPSELQSTLVISNFFDGPLGARDNECCDCISFCHFYTG